MLAPCGISTYRSWTCGYAAREMAVTSRRPSTAHSFSVWMSSRTCSNSNPRVSTAPDARPQNMNASSGSGLCPSRISTGGEATIFGVSKPVSEAIQDYLKEIYKLEAAEERATTSAIARRMDVAPSSVTAMVKKLAALGLAEHEPYRGVVLTGAGKRVALEVVRHHRLLELYLAETLGLHVDDVHAEADRLEHAISEELEAKIDAQLGYPTHDPHGEPIPDAELNVASAVDARRT